MSHLRRFIASIFAVTISGIVAEECFNNPNEIYYQNIYDNTQYCAFGCCESRGYKYCCSYVGPVIGIVGGIIVVVALVVVAMCCFRHHRKKEKAIILREAHEFQRQRSIQKELARSRESMRSRSKSDSELSYDKVDSRDYRHIDETSRQYGSRRSYRRDDRDYRRDDRDYRREDRNHRRDDRDYRRDDRDYRRDDRGNNRDRRRSERDYSERYHSDDSYSDRESRRDYDHRPRDHRQSSRDRRSQDHRNHEHSRHDRHPDRDVRRNGAPPSYYSESRRSEPPSYRDFESSRGSTRGHSRREQHERY